MNRSLTIALPMHNGEARMRHLVKELLDLASELTDDFSVLIIDDGSTDDTFEVARELSARYPQISVQRHPVRRGLGPALEVIQRQVSSDVVIVHDGRSPVDVRQIRRLWHGCSADRSPSHSEAEAAEGSTEWRLDDLADLPAIHVAMARAHQRLLGFHLLRPGRRDEKRASEAEALTPHAHIEPRAEDADVGRIPPLPRPNFLSALAEFAWGE